MRTAHFQEHGRKTVPLNKEPGGLNRVTHTLLSLTPKKRMKLIGMLQQLKVRPVAGMKTLDTGSIVAKDFTVTQKIQQTAIATKSAGQMIDTEY